MLMTCFLGYLALLEASLLAADFHQDKSPVFLGYFLQLPSTLLGVQQKTGFHELLSFRVSAPWLWWRCSGVYITAWYVGIQMSSPNPETLTPWDHSGQLRPEHGVGGVWMRFDTFL